MRPVNQQPQANDNLLGARTRKKTYEIEFRGIPNQLDNKSPRYEQEKDHKKEQLSSALACITTRTSAFTATTSSPWIFYALYPNSASLVCSAGFSLLLGATCAAGITSVGCPSVPSARSPIHGESRTLEVKELSGETRKITILEYTSLTELHTLIEKEYKQPMLIGSTVGITALQPTESCCYTESFPIQIDEQAVINVIHPEKTTTLAQRLFCCPCSPNTEKNPEQIPLMQRQG